MTGEVTPGRLRCARGRLHRICTASRFSAAVTAKSRDGCGGFAYRLDCFVYPSGSSRGSRCSSVRRIALVIVLVVPKGEMIHHSRSRTSGAVAG